MLDAPRPLDREEQEVLAALRGGAADVLTAGAASFDVRWKGEAGVNEWPVFILMPSARNAPSLTLWLQPGDRELDGGTAISWAIGDPDEGILGRLGAPDGRLTETVARWTNAFVLGHATFEAHLAAHDEWEGEIARGALTVLVHCRYSNGGSSTRGYLADAETFRRITGISVAEDLGEQHSFAPYV